MAVWSSAVAARVASVGLLTLVLLVLGAVSYWVVHAATSTDSAATEDTGRDRGGRALLRRVSASAAVVNVREDGTGADTPVRRLQKSPGVQITRIARSKRLCPVFSRRVELYRRHTHTPGTTIDEGATEHVEAEVED
ncbi:unnamed protein product [Vitrella brassicaformis CCMP3155]|uniref:Uncharacterized protein n=1 Tax=Vitrella brassicaformis (strain CCMP3155) TaxID=1169540 RepID=A0A0G4H4U4_VITBC|nr:unnamed protein product [Vitrella brassicaformis CCMP3155]|mmetsp:Transcript_35436/g.88054  ORF Transcript_35436/g.88054 Transcript_35436/m.88054 type:complete len:137 (-) Transcript_35436:403-813(-)|eukprot:CEM38815.1 unnamed protein product [Vitrella brassicaformis CCMP3155]